MIKTIKLEKKGLDNIKLLSGAQLKYIAFLSMLIDHVNKALIYPILDGGLLLEELHFLYSHFSLLKDFSKQKVEKNILQTY